MTLRDRTGAGAPILAEADRTDGPARLAAFQLLADCIERQDMLLMEVRHLQTNLIHSMRFPELHAALRFEESFIFGAVERASPDRSGAAPAAGGGQMGWSQMFEQSFFAAVPRSEMIANLAEAFVPVLPTPDDDKSFQMKTGDLGERGTEHAFPILRGRLDVHAAWRHAVAPIARALRRRALSGRWDDRFDEHYRLYSALQTLKRNLVVDKLHVACHGRRAFAETRGAGRGPQEAAARGAPEGDTPIGAFLFARSVAMANMAVTLDRLSDHHDHFEKSIDLGLQESHRPITGRRREQGVYQHVLSERAREMFIDIARLVRHLLELDHSDALYRGMPNFLHRWDHSHTSRNADTLAFARSRRVERTGRAEDATEGLSRQYPSFSTFTVNTSFWMPDRPDLQPVIAHEAAHCVLVELFGEMAEPIERTGVDAPLVDLWRALMSAKAEVLNGPAGHEDDARHKEQLREILADILAMTVTGPGYLFALFQELAGNTAARHARRDDWREWRDMGAIETLLIDGVGADRTDMFWYVRLTVAARVLELTRPDRAPDPLADTLVSGVIACCGTLHAQLRSMRRDRGADAMRAAIAYADMIVGVLQASGALPVLGEWRRKTATLVAPQSDRCDVDPAAPERDRQDEADRGGALVETHRRRLVEFIIGRKAAAEGRACHAFLGVQAQQDGGRRDAANRARRRLQESVAAPAAQSRRKTDTQLLIENWLGEVEAAIPARLASPEPICGTDALVAADAVIAFRSLYVGHDVVDLAGMIDGRRALAAETAPELRREKLDALIGEVPIFRKLGDVPWQSSMFRAMDLLALVDRRVPPRPGWCMFEDFSSDFAPGREALQLALETWGFERRRSVDSLSELCRLSFNLLGLPVTDLSRWRDRPHDATTLLHGRMAAALRRDGPSWTPDAGPSEPASARLERELKPFLDAARPPASEAASEAAAADRLGAAVEQALKRRLGVALDADFMELDLLDAFWKAQDDAPADAQRGRFFAHLFRILHDADPARFADVTAALDARIAQEGPPPAAGVDAARAALREFCGRIEAAENAPTEDVEDAALRLLRALGPALLSETDLRGSKVRSKGAMRDFAFAPQVRRLSDHVVQSVRIFELMALIEAARRLHDESAAFDPEAFAGLGALQTIKLDRSYPDGVMPLDVKRRRPCVSDDAMARLRTLVARRGLAPETLRAALEADLTQPVHWFLDGLARRPAEDGRSDGSLQDILTAAAIARGRFIDRLVRIHEHDPAQFAKGLAEDLSWLDQDIARPLPRRHRLQPRTARRIAALARAQIRSLTAPLLPLTRMDVHLAPIAALAALAADGRDDAPSQAAAGLHAALDPRGPEAVSPGLRSFEALHLSRLSLVDSNWWRELNGDANGADQDDEAERASFLHHDPRPEGGALRRAATLGRYDLFLFSSSSVLGQSRLPVLDARAPRALGAAYSSPGRPFSRIRDEYGFRSYFERREQCIAAALGSRPVRMAAPEPEAPTDLQDAAGDPSPRPSDLLAVISVRLDRRSSRLGFVHRLRQADLCWRRFYVGDMARAGCWADADFRRGVVETIRASVALNGRSDLPPAARAAFFAARDRQFAGGVDGLEAVFGCEPEGALARALLDDPLQEGAGRAMKSACRMGRIYGDLPPLSVEALGPFLRGGDGLLLGEGWSDIYLLIQGPRSPSRSSGPGAETEQARRLRLAKGACRLFDVFAIQHALFQDPMVHRTEMFIRPAAIPFAAADPRRFSVTLSARTREDRNLDGEIERMVQKARGTIAENMAGEAGVSILHIPGRNDLEFQVEALDRVRGRLRVPGASEQGARAPLSALSPSAALEALHELVGAGAKGGGSEDIVTRVGFRHFPGLPRDEA